jgi:Zn-dependent protease with chaperone function
VSSEEVPALVFGPGLPPGGARGSLAVSPLGVEVAAGGRSQRADLASVSLRAAGFGKPGLEIAWRDEEGSWAAHVLDHSTAQRLLELPALANSAQGAVFRSAQRRTAVRRSIGWSALAAYLLLPAVLLMLVVLNAGTLAGWVAERIPTEQETRLGRQAFEGMRSSLNLRDEGPAWDAATSIVARLTQGSKYQYEVHVSQDDTLNAFAMPGGIVVVNTGLIAATGRPEELAGVLAHEVQHVELRHSIRGLIKELGLRGLWALATGDLGGTLAGQAALELTSLKFSRDDEAEADSMAFDALLRAGIDPAGMPAFFETMSKEDSGAPVALLSTHPLSEDRKRELERRVTEIGRKDFEPLSFGTWPPPSVKTGDRPTLQ